MQAQDSSFAAAVHKPVASCKSMQFSSGLIIALSKQMAGSAGVAMLRRLQMDHREAMQHVAYPD
ncbi:hypothetical protein [Pseudomonas viridiflava]|uniref:hypothetical protein n=1 Tax=Pseudomonas viridiflava TaxID=33069 RepID=UPI000F0257CE|nr:hypothetical protein [Pseudomonas viridiflava]